MEYGVDTDIDRFMFVSFKMIRKLQNSIIGSNLDADNDSSNKQICKKR